jgi:hypothetical protein
MVLKIFLENLTIFEINGPKRTQNVDLLRYTYRRARSVHLHMSRRTNYSITLLKMHIFSRFKVHVKEEIYRYHTL